MESRNVDDLFRACGNECWPRGGEGGFPRDDRRGAQRGCVCAEQRICFRLDRRWRRQFDFAAGPGQSPSRSIGQSGARLRSLIGSTAAAPTPALAVDQGLHADAARAYAAAAAHYLHRCAGRLSRLRILHRRRGARRSVQSGILVALPDLARGGHQRLRRRISARAPVSEPGQPFDRQRRVRLSVHAGVDATLRIPPSMSSGR